MTPLYSRSRLRRFPEVFELTDRVTVFRNGERVLTKRTADLRANELVKAMGREVDSRRANNRQSELRPLRRARF